MTRILLLIAAFGAASSAGAADRYAVSFAGAPVMTLAIDLIERDGAYRAEMRAEGDVLAAIDARLSGSDADGLRRYDFDADVSGWRQQTVVETIAGRPPRRDHPAGGARIAPPASALDPIAAYVAALRAARAGRCPAAMTVFDGWRTIAITFEDAAPVDDASDRFACAFDVDTTVAGGSDPHGLDALLDAGTAVFTRDHAERARLEGLRVGPDIFGLRLERVADEPSAPDARPVSPLEGKAL